MNVRFANAGDYGVGWDGDGVLYDSRQAQEYAHNTLRVEAKMPILSRDDIYRRMGGLAHDSFEDFPEDVDREELHQTFYQHYEEALNRGYVVARAGARDAVLKIQQKGLRQGMLTHGSRFVRPCLAVAGISPAVFGDALIDSDVLKHHELRGKPYADGFAFMLRRMGVTASKAAFVGDMPNDVRAARGYGIDNEAESRALQAGLVIAVTGGFATRRELKRVNPDIILRGPGNVPGVVAKKLIAPQLKGRYR